MDQNTKGRPIIVCTSHRGVFFGYADNTDSDVINLKNARMAIYWGTTRGVMQLAEEGPNKNSKISARADLQLRGITCVMEVTAAATDKWESA